MDNEENKNSMDVTIKNEFDQVSNVRDWIKRYCLNKDIIQVRILNDGSFMLHNKNNDMFYVF